MNKDLRSLVREFAVTISDGELEMLTSRLTHRMTDDLSSALNVLSKNKSIDTILGSAKTADEFYDLVDIVKETLGQECRRKGLTLTKGPVARSR